MSRQYPIISKMLREFGAKVKVKPSTAYIKDIDFDNAGQGAGDYLQKRGGKNTLSSADVARKLNIDEEDLLDALKGVTSKKMNEDYQAYKDGKKEKNTTFTKMYKDVQARRDFALTVEIAQGRREFSDDIITERPSVAKEVYQMVMGEPMPKEPHWNAVKEQIAKDYPDNVEARLAESAKPAESADKLEEVINAVTQRSELNVEKLQAILKDYARTAVTDPNLSKSLQEDIARLTEYAPEPTSAFPEGRQSAELEKVLQKIIGARESIDKSNMLEAIDGLLDKSNLRRVGKGRVVSLYADAQKELDEIREIRIAVTPEESKQLSGPTHCSPSFC